MTAGPASSRRGVAAAARLARALGLLAIALAAPAAAAAGAGEGSAAPPRAVVLLDLRAEPHDALALRETLEELCDRLGLGLHDKGADPPVSAASVVAELSIDVASPAGPAIVVVRGEGAGAVALRRSLPVGRSRSVTLESAATVAYTALETLVQAPERAVAGPAAPAPAGTVPSSGDDAMVAAGGSVFERPRRFGLEAAPLFLWRTGEAQSGAAFGGGLRLGGGWRSVPLEPSFALTGSIREGVVAPQGGPTGGAVTTRTYALRLSVDAAVVSRTRVALHAGPSFAIEATDWPAPPVGIPAPDGFVALRPGLEVRLLVGVSPSVQLFLGGNGDCAVGAPPSSPPPMRGPAPLPQQQPSGDPGARCGLTGELGVALTLFGAPAVRLR